MDFNSTLPQFESPVAACFKSLPLMLGVALCNVRLVCSCSVSAHVLMLLPEAVWDSFVTNAGDNMGFLHAVHFSTHSAPSVSLSGPALWGSALMSCYELDFTHLLAMNVL